MPWVWVGAVASIPDGLCQGRAIAWKPTWASGESVTARVAGSMWPTQVDALPAAVAAAEAARILEDASLSGFLDAGAGRRRQDCARGA